MKYIFSIIILLIFSYSFGQLKKKNIGWYNGESAEFTLYQNIKEVKSKDDFIDVESSKICLYIANDGYKMRIGKQEISGNITITPITKKEVRLQLGSYDFGQFDLLLHTKKKYIILSGKGQQPSNLLVKLKKKKTCD